jgi:hypothetical protein
MSSANADYMYQCKWLPEGDDKAIINFGDSGMSIAIIKL